MPRSLSSNKPLRRPDHEEKPEVKAGYIHLINAYRTIKSQKQANFIFASLFLCLV